MTTPGLSALSASHRSTVRWSPLGCRAPPSLLTAAAFLHATVAQSMLQFKGTGKEMNQAGTGREGNKTRR